MACCSEKSDKRKRMMNDTEVEDILSNNSGGSSFYQEKSMSPVLNVGLNNRKFLLGRRLNRKKSTRVKLTDRFKEAADKECITVNPILSIPVSLDESISTSQTKDLIDHLDKLEQLDTNRKNIYNALTAENKYSNDHLKKASYISKHKTGVPQDNTNVNDTSTNISNGQRSIVEKVSPLPVKTPTIGFQTAMGKSIHISDTNVSKYSKLFEDIIYPTQTNNAGRQNKHNFLSKPNITSNDETVSISNLNFIYPTVEIKNSNYSNGFSTASGSKIDISKVALTQAKRFFNEETFNDIEFNKDNVSKLYKINTLPCIDASKEIANTSITTEGEFSFTQAICESGISNTQITCAVDKILSSVKARENDFTGFTKENLMESCEQFQTMKKCLNNKYEVLINAEQDSICFTSNGYCDTEKLEDIDWSQNWSSNKKRSSDECFLPPMKRPRIFNKDDNTVGKHFGGFASASGKSITISEKHKEFATTLFNDMDINLDFSSPLEQRKSALKNEFNSNNQGLITKNCSSLSGLDKSSKNFRGKSKINPQTGNNIFDKQSKKCDNKSADGISAHQSQDKTEDKTEDKTYVNEMKSEELSSDLSKTLQNVALKEFAPKNLKNNNIGFCNASGKKIQISENSLNKVKGIFDDLIVYNTEKQTNEQTSYLEEKDMQNFSSKSESFDQNEPGTAKNVGKNNTSNCSKFNKKKLGVSRCKQLQICDDKLDKAKMLFNENFSGMSPIKPRQNSTYTSTPIKHYNYLTSKSCGFRPNTNFDNFVDTRITPIKIDNQSIREYNYNVNEDILCTSPTKNNWMNDLKNEREKLEKRLQIILEREKLGDKLLHYLQNGKSDRDKRPREGILYKMKTTCKKVPLASFVDNKKLGGMETTIKAVINSKNAENVHFKGQYSASIVTKDGAVVIPNINDLVGLSEIKNAFEAMPGVEPRLIPNGWIKNHYKWIVWKLASYENMFSTYFSECMNIENIMQQLKYRYDREIDRAERSALRKIYEKDDAPQKRIVLYVADIKMLNSKNYELELSDGWYAIRTIIDDPLCNQIMNGKIKIGTKLIISGAEILNCEGCYPLEAPNLVCLKINCNSTRRAAWYTKLGFQPNPNPFPIQLHSIYPHGGTIAAIKISLVRVYPLKYMERMEGRSVWRNRKAEEIAAQKWEIERGKKLEKIQNDMKNKYEHNHTKSAVKRSPILNISNIKCPKELYDILETSNDPESIQENLSSTQKEAIYNYQTNLSMKKQAELMTEMNDSISKLKLVKRDVVAVLKLLIIDLIGNPNRTFNFFIWHPTETHLQILTEGKSFLVQNVAPKQNGDLSSNIKTTFKNETEDNNCIRYKRFVIPLARFIELNTPPDFNEFDTVGIVVQTKVESHKQEVWITDNEGRLLFITINEGPSTCILLDNLKRGQATTACNLTYCGLKKDVIQAVANHFTIFTSNSRYKHLQEGLEEFKKEIKDVNALLRDCDSKIEVFTIIADIKNSFTEDFEDIG